MKPRGLPEVPMPNIRVITERDAKGNVVNTHRVAEFTEEHRRFLVDMREQVLQLRQRTAVPDAPTNVKATGQAFSNLVQFTRSGDADYYEILSARTPSLKDPNLQTNSIANSASWVDHVGQTGIKVFYWVRARKNTGATSLEVGPVNATTVASAAGVTPPTPPPPSNIIVTDQSTGRQVPYTLTGPRSFRL